MSWIRQRVYARVRFDRLTDRWFLTILDIPSDIGANGSRILIAMSDGPNITASTSWTYFFFDQDRPRGTGSFSVGRQFPFALDASVLVLSGA